MAERQDAAARWDFLVVDTEGNLWGTNIEENVKAVLAKGGAAMQIFENGETVQLVEGEDGNLEPTEVASL